jgi:hypothetical protein
LIGRVYLRRLSSIRPSEMFPPRGWTGSRLRSL